MTPVNIPEIPARQLVRWALAVVLTIGCFWLLYRYQVVLLMILAAIILSTAIRPGVVWLVGRGLPRPVAILLIITTGILLLAVFVWYAAPILVEQGSTIRESLDVGYQSLVRGLEQIPNILVQRLLLILPENLNEITNGSEMLEENGSLPDLIAPLRQVAGSILGILAIGLMTIFWLIEGEGIKHAAYLLIPLSHRERITGLVAEIEVKVSKFILGQGLLCLVIGGLAFIAYTVIGLPHALLLAIITGLFEAVPILGAVLGIVPAIIVGLSVSPLTALWVIVAAVVIQQLENNLLVPRVMDKTIGIRPLVTLLALLALGSLYGILGALVALPLAAIIQLVLEHFVLATDDNGQKGLGRDRVSVLRYETQQLVQDVRRHVRQKEGVPSAASDELEDEIESIALGLDGYLAARQNGSET